MKCFKLSKLFFIRSQTMKKVKKEKKNEIEEMLCKLVRK